MNVLKDMKRDILVILIMAAVVAAAFVMTEKPVIQKRDKNIQTESLEETVFENIETEEEGIVITVPSEWEPVLTEIQEKFIFTGEVEDFGSLYDSTFYLSLIDWDEAREICEMSGLSSSCSYDPFGYLSVGDIAFEKYTEDGFSIVGVIEPNTEEDCLTAYYFDSCMEEVKLTLQERNIATNEIVSVFPGNPFGERFPPSLQYVDSENMIISFGCSSGECGEPTYIYAEGEWLSGGEFIRQKTDDLVDDLYFYEYLPSFRIRYIGDKIIFMENTTDYGGGGYTEMDERDRNRRYKGGLLFFIFDLDTKEFVNSYAQITKQSQAPEYQVEHSYTSIHDALLHGFGDYDLFNRGLPETKEVVVKDFDFKIGVPEFFEEGESSFACDYQSSIRKTVEGESNCVITFVQRCEAGSIGEITVDVIPTTMRNFWIDRWMGLGDTLILEYGVDKKDWINVQNPESRRYRLPMSYFTNHRYDSYIYGSGDAGYSVDSALVVHPKKDVILNVRYSWDSSYGDPVYEACEAKRGGYNIKDILNSIQFTDI